MCSASFLKEGAKSTDWFYVFVKSTSEPKPVGFVLQWVTLRKSTSPMFLTEKLRNPKLGITSKEDQCPYNGLQAT